MQRDPRHDHGFLKPDPLLTKELGIPNACNRCHTDRTVDWAITHADAWYGTKMQSRQRERTEQSDREPHGRKPRALPHDQLQDVPRRRA